MRLVAKCTTWFTGLDLCLILVSFHQNWLLFYFIYSFLASTKQPNIWCFFFFLLAMHCTFSITCEQVQTAAYTAGKVIWSSVSATCCLWGADQIYKKIIHWSPQQSPWFHLTFSPKSICLWHQRRARRNAIKSLIKAVTACNGREWNEIHWSHSVSGEGTDWEYTDPGLFVSLL